jgi:hypothetical protein
MTAVICVLMNVGKATIRVTIDSDEEILHWSIDKCSWNNPRKIMSETVMCKMYYTPQSYAGSISIISIAPLPERTTASLLDKFDAEKIISHNLCIAMDRYGSYNILYEP